MTEIDISSRIRDHYADHYEGGDSEWRRLTAIDKVNNIVSLCSDLSRRSILEIGSGEGSLLSRMSDLGFAEQLYGLEISASGVEVTKRKEISRLVECQLFDGYRVPYEDDKFDIAVLSHVIEHVEHPRQLLYEASRVAKYVFVEVPLEDTARLANDFVFSQVGHINFFSPKTIRLLVQSCDMHVLKQITMNPSKETYKFAYGSRGIVKYYVKQSFVSAFPGLASSFFSYCGALVCRRP